MQYVGARYVPKFMGLYDATQAYEALCVVDNGLGTSYISTQPVPAGTPLTNTTYWAIYGASSGAIINLQNQIGDLSSLTTADQSNLVNAINEVDSDIQTLSNKLMPYNNIGKILIVSDSYGLNVDANNKTFADIASDLLGVDIDLVATSSGSFGANAPYLQDGLENYTGDRNKIGLILVVAGANDCSTTNASFGTIISGMNSFDAYAKANYPNAKISIMACGLCYANATGRTADARLLVIESYMTGAHSLGWGYAENSEYLLHDTRMLKSDLLHPSSDGVIAIGRAIAQYIRTGVVTFYHRNIHNSIVAGSNVSSAICKFDELFINNQLMWYRNSQYCILEVALTTPVTVTGGSTNWIDVGNIQARLVDTFSADNKWLATVMLSVQDTSNVYHNGLGRISIQHGELYMDIFTDASEVKGFKVIADSIYMPKG